MLWPPLSLCVTSFGATVLVRFIHLAALVFAPCSFWWLGFSCTNMQQPFMYPSTLDRVSILFYFELLWIGMLLTSSKDHTPASLRNMGPGVELLDKGLCKSSTSWYWVFQSDCFDKWGVFPPDLPLRYCPFLGLRSVPGHTPTQPNCSILPPSLGSFHRGLSTNLLCCSPATGSLQPWSCLSILETHPQATLDDVLWARSSLAIFFTLWVDGA